MSNKLKVFINKSDSRNFIFRKWGLNKKMVPEYSLFFITNQVIIYNFGLMEKH